MPRWKITVTSLFWSIINNEGLFQKKIPVCSHHHVYYHQEKNESAPYSYEGLVRVSILSLLLTIATIGDLNLKFLRWSTSYKYININTLNKKKMIHIQYKSVCKATVIRTRLYFLYISFKAIFQWFYNFSFKATVLRFNIYSPLYFKATVLHDLHPIQWFL